VENSLHAPGHRATPKGILSIRGAREHNLRGVDLDLPHGLLVGFCGVSGSGKSSLVFDTVHREGQRRFLECLSPFARQFLGPLEQPAVDRIDGLPPTVAVDQKGLGRNLRSTVGTVTEVHDYFRLLYARLGTPHCPSCGREVAPQSPEAIVDRILEAASGRPATLLAPVIRDRRGEHKGELAKLSRLGYVRARVDGTVVRLEEAAPLEKRRRHTVEVVLDRLTPEAGKRARIREAVGAGISVGGGTVILSTEEGDRVFSASRACPHCRVDLPEFEPRLFSFNSPHGACPRCEGTGRIGPEGREEEEEAPGEEDDLEEAPSDGARRAPRTRGVRRTCPDCGGGRLNATARAVTFRGKGIADLCREPVRETARFFDELVPDPREAALGRDLFRELRERLAFLEEVGVGYLSLERSVSTLSGGESQRVRLGAQIGAALCGIVYTLDEPTVGLHPKDVGRLLGALRRLRDRGNTVLVVEHDETTLRACDLLVDLGPGAAAEGGRIVAFGTPDEVARTADSPTGAFLRGEGPLAVPRARRRPKGFLRVKGARGNNLKGIDVAFPLGCLVAVTGVSGSGKSTLVEGTLARELRRRLHGAGEVAEPHDAIEGAEGLSSIVELRAAPLGRTPRSNPATYTGVFDLVRELFAALPEARMRGYGPGRFSFNVAGGRCEACLGAGVRELRLDFLAPVLAPCPECEGSRFNAETLAVRRGGKSIAEVLDMTVEEARAFFAEHPRIASLLEALSKVGLGYLRLGQPSPNLSGGEAQRVRLAAALGRRLHGKRLLLLDEPTSGLHASDVGTLLEALSGLVEAGHTVVVVEHHPDLVACADWVIDLGPGSGPEGGEIVAQGTPEEVAATPSSATGASLVPLLAGRKAPLRPSRDGRPVGAVSPPRIEIVGARANNLREVSVSIPRDRLVAVTGPSGSGKSSLALDVVYAEGRRRFVESLSTYARRFLGRLERANVDRIEGLGPSIAVEGTGGANGPRSTVATASEIHDALRVLYARAGTPHCPKCGEPLAAIAPSALAAEGARHFAGRKGFVLAPLAAPTEEGLLPDLAQRLRRAGFARLLVDGRERRLEEVGTEPVGRLELLVDRVEFAPRARARIAEAAEQAASFGDGTVVLALADGGERRTFSTRGACAGCGYRSEEPLSPRHFSFNLLAGACPECRGIGERGRCDPERIVARPREPLLLGAVHPSVERLLRREDGLYATLARAVARRHRIDLSRPFGDLPEKAKDLLLRGTGERRFVLDHDREGRRTAHSTRLRKTWPGLAGLVERSASAGDLAGLLTTVPCEACDGERLRREARAVRLGGKRMPEFLSQTVGEARESLASLSLPEPGASVLRELAPPLLSRLETLEAVGLPYLALDRPMSSLSGGEARRVRLASVLGTRLSGVVYVLDEPTVGLHPCDVEPLIEAMKRLREQENTVIVVEHDEAVVRAADWVIDLGPGAGREGGTVVACGPPSAIEAARESPTGRMLRREVLLPPAPAEKGPARGALHLRGARARNLRGVSVEFPLGRLVAVCGPSGAGKSALVFESLLPALAQAGVQGAGRWRGARDYDALSGASGLDRVVVLGSAPVGRTPLSNPATYTGIFEEIRDLFARTPEARARGFGPGRFSPFVPGGRCEGCRGRGSTRVPMEFLPDVWLPCEECGGRRFDEETLSVRLQGRTIAEVLDLEVAAAREFFAHAPRIRAVLDALDFLGLGYVRLGQSAPTLSGGESQRVRLAAALAGAVTRPEPSEDGVPAEEPTLAGEAGRRLFLLDEPTVGLHLVDLAPLLAGLRRLVEAGDTVLLVEHHPEILARADHLIEMGPGAGEEGGRVVFCGSPAAIRKERSSVTGRVLRGRA
jgi:excinuclease ABC subunit A